MRVCTVWLISYSGINIIHDCIISWLDTFFSCFILRVCYKLYTCWKWNKYLTNTAGIYGNKIHTHTRSITEGHAGSSRLVVVLTNLRVWFSWKNWLKNSSVSVMCINIDVNDWGRGPLLPKQVHTIYRFQGGLGQSNWATDGQTDTLKIRFR